MDILKLYVFETAHLQLRRPSTEDTIVIRDLWRNEKVRQYLGGIIEKEIIDEKIISIQDHWNKLGFGQCAVFDKGHNQIIGICGLHQSDDGVELSYMFFPKSWRKGLASEAALTCLKYGFNNLKLNKIIAITQEKNIPSCRLLEKIGMQHIKSFIRFGETQSLYELTKIKWDSCHPDT